MLVSSTFISSLTVTAQCHRLGGELIRNYGIILPSNFAGGALRDVRVTLRVTHGDRSQSYEYAQDRPTSTPVVAWYAGASTSLGPITDGHQLALLYKIVHTTYAPKRVGQPNCLLILQTCAPWRVLL